MGGAERQFFELIKNINKGRFHVTVYLYAVNEPPFYADILNTPDIEVIVEPLNSRFKIIKILKAIYKIRKFLQKTPFDLVQTSLVMNDFLVRVAAIGLKGYKMKIIASMRNNFDNYQFYQKILEAIFIHRSHIVINSKHSAYQFEKFCLNKYNTNIHTILNGYDTNKFSRRSLVNNSIIFGNVGRMDSVKNQTQLLHALTNIKDSYSCYIIGDKGDQYHNLLDCIHNNGLEKSICLKSYVTNIEDYYKKFDVFVLTSLFEGCSNSLFEAMLSGCLCVVSQTANTDNLIVHGENGLVYDGSTVALTSCLNHVIQIFKTNEYEKICSNSFQFAYDNFKTSNMVNAYEILYNDVIAENNLHHKSQ